MKIEGTATYGRVDVRRDRGTWNVTGYYLGDQTTYEAPEVRVGGVPLSDGDGTIVIDSDDMDEQDWIWVQAGEDGVLRITREKPDGVD